MAKSKVAIVTDSTCNLPPETLEKYDIHVIPQILNWGGQSLQDGVDITTEDFYDRLATSSELPTTSQPSPGQFHEFFSEVAESADSIVGLFVSENLSGTLASAHAAKAMMDDYPLEIVDSKSASLGLGLLAMSAGRAAQAGMSAPEIAAQARAEVPTLRVLFVVDTLEYLHKGGRIGGAQRLMGSLLSIKPVLHIEDGRIEPMASVRTKKKAVKHMTDAFSAEVAGKSRVHAGVIHARAPEAAAELAQWVQETANPDELVVAELSPVIGTHVGPGTVGMGFYTGP